MCGARLSRRWWQTGRSYHHRESNARRPAKNQALLHNRVCGCTHVTNMKNKSRYVGRSSATMNRQWTDRQYIQVSEAGCRLGNRRGNNLVWGTGVLLWLPTIIGPLTSPCWVTSTLYSIGIYLTTQKTVIIFGGNTTVQTAEYMVVRSSMRH